MILSELFEFAVCMVRIDIHNVVPKSVGHSKSLLNHCLRDFPGGTVVKNPPANSRDMGLIPGLGRSHILQSN